MSKGDILKFLSNNNKEKKDVLNVQTHFIQLYLYSLQVKKQS